MIRVILLAVLFVVCVLTEDAKIDPSASASRNQEYFGSEARRGKSDKDKDLELTEAENRIIQDLFSPDYYEPNIILDYRYMKTGGRGYARGDGGQILILPERSHMPAPQNNYDTLLEYLRLKHLEYISKAYTPNSGLRENYAEMDGENNRENENMEGNMRGNIRENIRDNSSGNMRQNKRKYDTENSRQNQNKRGNMRENMEGNLRQNRRENDRDNSRGNENVGGNMRQNRKEYDRDNSRGNENIRGNIRENRRQYDRENSRGNENMGGNMRQNRREYDRENSRGNENMGENIRENIGENIRQNRSEYVRNILDDRRDFGYRNEKYGHDIEDKYTSDAEYGFALYNS